jgi:FKBP-type peptidyl-prolyl cis-trans isomerase FklB
MKYYKEIKNIKYTDLKIWVITGIFAILLLSNFSCSTDTSQATKNSNQLIVTFEDSLSYAMGINIGKNLPGKDLNKDLIKQGLDDYWNNNEPRLNNSERGIVLREFNIRNSEIERDAMAEARDETKVLSRKNKIAGQEFLDENRLKEGVLVKQRSGLQYKIIKEGVGAVPDFDDVVVVHYSGYLTDGFKFDSSIDRGSPMTLELKRFIAGWQEALMMMPVGSKWEIYVPYNLAYGEAGIAGSKLGEYVIPPSSTLIFEMELLNIVE